MCDKSNKNTLQHILHDQEAPRGEELTEAIVSCFMNKRSKDICGTLQLELLRILTT